MQAWDNFLQKLEKKLGKGAVDQWIRALEITGFDARNLYLQTNDPLKITWFNEYVLPYLKNGLLNNNNREVRVHLRLSFAKEKQTSKEEKTSSFHIVSDRLDPELTFANFLVSPENQMAYTLLHELSNSEFNPLFLYGGKHTGKTHLLTSVAHSLQEKGKKAFYVRAETFTSHVVQAIRLGRMLEFRKIYRNIDVLLVDGVDFFAKKTATQEEFFHTFNALQTIGKQIILSASSPPSTLPEIEQRLLSRFEWGISLEVKAANPRQILEKKASLWNLSYSEELLSYLAETFSKDPLVAMQALTLRTKGKSSLTPKSAAEFLQDLIAKKEADTLNIEKIISKIAHHFGVKIEDILGKSQAREHAQPRKIAMFLAREKLKMPFQKIGKIFGRDHSTVMSSVRQVQKGIDEKMIPLEFLKETLNNSFASHSTKIHRKR